MSETFLRRLYFFAVGLFLILPLIVVAGVSFNEKQDLDLPAGRLLPVLVRTDFRRSRNGGGR